MATTLEERVSELEAKMAKVLAEKPEVKPESLWWERRFGAFKDSPDYESAVQRGAEYRKAQPNAADNPEAIEL